MLLPGRNISMGKVTIAASGASPRPATAFVMTPTKSARVSVTVGIPCASILAAARPHAVAQVPQAALPMTTASTPLALTSAAVSSEHLDAREVRLEQPLEERQHAVGLPLLVA